jgi:hypothetical protein
MTDLKGGVAPAAVLYALYIQAFCEGQKSVKQGVAAEGGRARASKLSPEARSEIARKAARARHDRKPEDNK